MHAQMEIDRKELKYRARESMRLAHPSFWVVTLVYLLMTDGVSNLADLLLPAQGGGINDGTILALFFTILITLYSTVVNFGYNLWSLWTTRKLDPGLNSLLQGFSVAGRVIGMELMIVLFMMVFCIPITILVAIVLVVGASATNYPLLLLVVIAVVYASVWAYALNFALSPYLLADSPDDGAGAAVRRSRELMRGWKWELFKLEVSFLGWDILQFLLCAAVMVPFLWKGGFFTLIFSDSAQMIYQQYTTITEQFLPLLLGTLVTLPLSLWLTPYRSVSRSAFYEARLQAQKESAPQL